MFLALICPKAWGYAEKELPSFSEESFSSGETFSSDQTFFLSRAVLIDEKGVAICQVNLVENPEFLPQFAKPSSSNTLKPLDLPECEEQSLDIVAQYADQAWVKRDVAIAPVIAAGALAFGGGCAVGLATWILFTGTSALISESVRNPADNGVSVMMGGIYGTLIAPYTGSTWSFIFKMTGYTGIGAAGGLLCSFMADGIFYE